MPAFAFSKLLARSRYAMLGMVLLGVTASLVLYKEARDNETQRVRDDVKRRADTRHTLIRENLNGYVEGLYNLRNLFRLLRVAGLEKFRLMAQDTLERHPGFSSIQWVPIVTHADRAEVEAHGQRNYNRPFTFTEPGEDGKLRPAAERAMYYPLYYIDSLGGHEPALGLDYRATVLAAYFDRAAASGRLIVTEQFDYPTPTGPARRLAMICPVFANSPTLDKATAADRGACLGFVVGIFQINELLGQTWQVTKGQVADVMFLDSTPGLPADKRLLYYWSADRSRPKESAPTEEEFRSSWYREIPLLFGGRVWILLHQSKAGWFETQRTFIPHVVLTGGLVVTLLFAAFVRSASRRAELIEQEVNQRTAELRATQKQLEDDIHRRRETESLLRSSQQQLQGLMENSPNAIFVKDVEGRYLTVNRRFAQLHGREREHFIGQSDFDLFAPDVAARARMSDARVISTGKPVELEDSIAQNGGTHTSIVHKFPVIDESGHVHGLCGIATDISERKRAEAEIRENRRQLESILGQLPGMAFRSVNDGFFTPVYVSRGALGLTGHSARDFLDKNVNLQDIIHPEDRAQAQAAIASAVKKRRSFEIEYRIIDRSGRVKWVLQRGQGIYDEDGKLLFIEGLAIDITQRKDAEAEKLIVERRLFEGQKLESIGVLAGGIAHDFNNLLTGIIGNANLAGLELPKTSPLHHNLRQIENASQRAAELCHQMLAYAGKGRFVIQRVELGQLVENTVPLLRASISKRAQLRFRLEPGLPAVMADPTQMRQIVMNLVLNASEALNDQDGEITIATTQLRPSAGFFENAVLAPPEPSAEFIQLEVRDTGAGMSDETIAKIFDPFFTTKFAGRGLGLAAVQGIIRSHRGGLKVRSALGKGSTFTIFLPAAPAAQVEAAPAPRRTTATPWGQSGLALIVDDEDHVRKVTAHMLESCGLRCELARDGYEAIDIFRAKPNAYDVVVLDMTMPRLSGEETLPLLREIRPDVRVLFISGYNRREVVDTLGGAGTLAFIQKPFTLDALREQLQSMLG
jgi:PAS domain S-box-containing protein